MEVKTLSYDTVTLLTVDDEPLMTDLFQAFMNRWGFRVLTAQSGEEALALVSREDGVIRLIFSDMMMKGMNGLTLAKSLSVISPKIPVVLVSGNSYDENLMSLSPNIAGVIRKPYQHRKIYEIICQILKTEPNLH